MWDRANRIEYRRLYYKVIIKEIFDIQLHRTGTIEYKSSSIFLHEDLGTLKEFLI